MALPDTDTLTAGGIIGACAGGLLWLRKYLSSDRVDRANDNAQINIIATLQAERDAAVKRADEAVALREQAMSAMNGLQLQIAQLQGQVEALSKQVAALTPKNTPA
ncbi:MAG TPA: hypothetical protein VGV14_02915 [Rhodanobacter sp.]|nr:hypothetical protein [Rhodanobacter sp.]